MNLLRLKPATSATALRSLARLFAVLPLVMLLIGGQFVGGTHHHDAPGSNDSCPVCLHAGAPALGEVGLPFAPAPSFTDHRPHLAPEITPRTFAPRLAPSRAPPQA